MKTRYLLTCALLASASWVLGPGCTQDFDAFQACDPDEKVCDGACVPTDLPENGCSAESCAPCDLANASAACDPAGGGCAIETCVGTFRSCDEDPQSGCETNVFTDVAHCGGCGLACDPSHATPACVDGDCEIGTCDPDWEDCNASPTDGCEANLQNDALHCGDCDTECADPLTCQGGQCVLVCPSGMGDCNDDPDDGCETPLGTVEHCGGCNMPCDLANATPMCSNSMCTIAACDPGFDDCDGLDASGCEADLQTGTTSCGMCGVECVEGPNVATATCSGGDCQLQCSAGFGDCDGDADNGCETDVTDSVQHCGGCGQPCDPANGAGACNGGTCEIMSCTAPFEDCNGDPDDGCEANTQTSAAHCGTCGFACMFPNAAAACDAGMCMMGACDAPFEDCDNDPSDGCEVDTTTDPLHCGACDDPCPGGANASATCVNSACGIQCDAGFDDCDAAPGCETNTGTNVDHCGACGRPCSGNNVASKSCTNGACDSACVLGFGNCTTPAAPGADNGCETNVTDNDDNCGGCGNSCTMQGGANNDFECDGGIATQQTCGCSTSQECQGPGVSGFNASCAGSGRCSCGAVGNLTQCAVGESCILSGGQTVCSCGGGAACAAGLTCCETPAGCKDLQTDPQSCGACGHACPPGFACVGGTCQCDGDADCDGGSPGTCSAGVCACGPMMTSCGSNPPGRRCLPNGQCG